MNQPADIQIEVGGAAHRITATSNIQIVPTQHPYSGGFIAEATRYAQEMHRMGDTLGDVSPASATPVIRASGNKAIGPDSPPATPRKHVLTPVSSNSRSTIRR